MQGIYAIKNKINGKQYIGSTVDFKLRWKRHLNRLNDGNHHSRYLQMSWQKHGADNFEFIVLEHVSQKENLLEREQWWMDNRESSYNIAKFAGRPTGVKKSPEELARRKFTQGGDNHWSKRKKYTEESKRKMSESQKKLYASGYQHPGNKRVWQCDKEGSLIKVWKSLAEAARGTDVCGSAITHCIKGINKTAGGFKWCLPRE